jgi:MFS family permease
MTAIPESTSPSDLGETAAGGASTSLRTLRLRGLLVTLSVAELVLCLFWGAIQSIFLALQVQRINADGAAGALALIVGIGAIGAMVGAPIAGALTDRTRTRFGGRVPWIVLGAVVSLVLTILFAFATSVPQLIVYWLILQVATNFILTPLSVHIPERVPVQRRGLFSAAVGLTQLVGSTLGASIGALFSGVIPVGYVVVGVLLLAASLLFAVVNKRSNLNQPRTPVDVKAILKTFWVNPVKHPNFAWAFAGRFLLMIGYFPLTAYLLYILEHYLHLGSSAVGNVAGVSTALLIGSIVGSPLAGLLSDKIKASKPIILGASALLVIGFLVPFLWPTIPAMLIYGFCAGAGLSAYMAVDYVLITQVLPSADEAGKDLGIINITTTLPQTIGVFVAGIIVTVFGGYGALFPFAIAFVVIGALCLFRIRGVR